MHRWWQSQGAAATIERLRDALDFARLQYVRDDDAPDLQGGGGEPFDVGELDDANPEVGRLLREYNERSLDASLDLDTPAVRGRHELEESYEFDVDGTHPSFVIVQPQLRPVDVSVARSPTKLKFFPPPKIFINFLYFTKNYFTKFGNQNFWFNFFFSFHIIFTFHKIVI